MPFELTDNVNVGPGEEGRARYLEHFQQPYRAEGPAFAAPTPQALAAQYLNEPEVKSAYGLPDEMVSDLTGAGFQPAVGTALTSHEQSRLHLAAQKSLMGTATVSYVQMYRSRLSAEEKAGLRMSARDQYYRPLGRRVSDAKVAQVPTGLPRVLSRTMLTL